MFPGVCRIGSKQTLPLFTTKVVGESICEHRGAVKNHLIAIIRHFAHSIYCIETRELAQEEKQRRHRCPKKLFMEYHLALLGTYILGSGEATIFFRSAIFGLPKMGTFAKFGYKKCALRSGCQKKTQMGRYR